MGSKLANRIPSDAKQEMCLASEGIFVGSFIAYKKAELSLQEYTAL